MVGAGVAPGAVGRLVLGFAVGFALVGRRVGESVGGVVGHFLWWRYDKDIVITIAMTLS